MNLIGTMNNSEENLINKIAYLMARDESIDAPSDSVKWAKNLFRARIAEPQKSFVRKVLAVLQIDLPPNKAAFGERSAAGSQARQMLFEAGEITIDLRVSETEKGFDLRGQILGEVFENASVKIGGLTAEINELGEFSLRSVSPGVYRLTIENAKQEIVIENLELK